MIRIPILIRIYIYVHIYMYTCMLAQEKKQCRAAYNNNKQQRTGILGLAACTQLHAFHIKIPTWSACRTEGRHPPTPAPHPACPEHCPAPLHAHRPFPQCQYFCLVGIPFSPTQMSNSLRQKSFCSIPPYFYCISSHTEWLEVMKFMNIFQDSSDVLDNSGWAPKKFWWILVCKTSFLIG